MIDLTGWIEGVRTQQPLVHHITNYVTVNDCANITLAIGASPIMADAAEEAAEIAAMASAVVINIGTLNARTIPSMIEAGRCANRRGAPVILDPVGAGASRLRGETANRLLQAMHVDVLRGNISEIRFIAGLSAATKGVDAAEQDATASADAAAMARSLAARLGCVVAITGKQDVVSDGNRTILIDNGHPMLSRLTGTGCMCSSLVASCCGAHPGHLFEATVAGILTMGIAGEIAYEAAGERGNGSFRVALHDAVSRMDDLQLAERARYHEAD